MNAREANELRETLTMLEHGPGAGWRELLEGAAGGEHGADGKGLEMRAGDLKVWRDTWIAPPLRRLVARYWRPNKTSRREARRRPTTATSTLRETLRRGEERQAAGVAPTGVAFAPGESTAPYWIGFYHSIARQALARLEELEARMEAAQR